MNRPLIALLIAAASAAPSAHCQQSTNSAQYVELWHPDKPSLLHSIALNEAALQKAEAAHASNEVIARIYSNLGSLYEDTAMYSKAEDAMRHAVSLLHNGPPDQFAAELAHLGLLHAILINPREAEKELLEAIHIRETLNDPLALAAAQGNLASVYLKDHRYKQALDPAQNAMDVLGNNPKVNPADRISARQALAFALCGTHQCNRAIPIFQDAVQLAIASFGSDSLPVGIANFILGYGYWQNGEMDKAEAWMRRGIDRMRVDLGWGHAVYLNAMADSLPSRVERHLPEIYLILALAITGSLCLLTAPFSAPDEPNQVCRALSITAGHLILSRSSDEVGAPIDANVLRVMNAMNDIRMNWERTTRDFHDRPYGAVPEDQQRELSGVRWAHRTEFVPFGNTAVYPPALYLPAIAGLRIGEAADLTVFESLRLARLFCTVTGVALGWLALRLCAWSRWQLAAFLLLPSTLFLNAGCMQDALLLPIAALIAAMVTRPLAEQRQFTRLELVVLAALLAICGTARPPYFALAFVLFLPATERAGKGLRQWLAPALAFATVLALCGLWRMFVAPLGLDSSDDADPDRQQLFLLSHPLAAAWALTRGTAEAAWDFIHRGLYVIGWNDLLPHHGAAAILSISLAAILLCAPASPIRSWRGRLLLTCAVAAPLLGISLAEYIIWTPPGFHTVYGIQPRYWLPVMPLAAILLRSCQPLSLPPNARTWLLLSATMLIAITACTLPSMVSEAFYRDSVRHVFELNWR